LDHKHEATTLESKFLTFPNLLTLTRIILIAPIVLAILTNNMIPAASIAGKAYPNHSISYNKRKHYEGTIAFMLVGFL